LGLAGVFHVSSASAPIGNPIGNFDQPVLPILDPAGFDAVRTAIETAFSSSRVTEFLKSLDRSSVRIRQFEHVLDKGLLGSATKSEYARLGDGDQGQIREYYLASLERVPLDLRNKFFKLYAYY
jgi:hypothetical protein